MKKFNQNMGEMDNSEFYKEVTGSGGVNFSGSQYDGRFGSSLPHTIGGGVLPDANPDFGGINMNNQQYHEGNKNYHGDNMDWEKSQGAFINPTGTFKDLNENMHYEVDIRPIIKVTGMPNPNKNHNTHDDCNY